MKLGRVQETIKIFRRSLIYQTKEFFQNSTLHGVRYIAETGRPVGEKFMWFCFTSIGAVTALVIIMSLWEKFHTNPTITGLDTSTENENIIFPSILICPEISFNRDKVYDVAYKELSNNDHETASMVKPFLELLTSLSFENIMKAYTLAKSITDPDLLEKRSLREWAFSVMTRCQDTLTQCQYGGDILNCCANFNMVYTEHGTCYAFNSRFQSNEKEDLKSETLNDLHETDKKWALFFIPNSTSKVFIFSHEEYFGSDFNAQIDWEEGQTVEARIYRKNTFTTDAARQLSIGQRKCIFFDEVKLKFFPEEYTFSSCMKECRMNKAIQLCKCNPPFYKPVKNVPMCKLGDFPCLDEYKANITNIKNCLHCELSCSKTVFNIDKLIRNSDHPESNGVLVEFLTWPIIRFKREVLFGWVDLLVSFGGIASLFLGFSLLSGVEIIYYFTLRACCMVYKNRQELYEIEERIKKEPPPLIDLSFKLQINKKELNARDDDNETIMNNNLNNKNLNEKIIIPNGGDAIGKRQKSRKEYANYAKSLYKTRKVLPLSSDSNWEYGQYLP